MIAVDTSVWVDFFHNRRTDAVNRLIDLIPAQPLVVGDLVLCEILRGVRDDRAASFILVNLAGFNHRNFCGPRVAEKAASNYRRLRARGITIRGTVDIIIGTWCIEHGMPLLHSDRDFEPMERHLGLKAA